MFSDPYLPPGQKFPPFPYGDPRWQALADRLDVRLDARHGADDVLTQHTRYAVGWVEGLPDYYDDCHGVVVSESALGEQLVDAGLVLPIEPRRRDHDYALVDGGNSKRYDIRLAQAEKLRVAGMLAVPELVVFGGQAPRSDHVDNMTVLRERIASVQGKVRDWAADWLHRELHRPRPHDDRWHRPFATERELAYLSLMRLHGKTLEYVRSVLRADAEAVRIHPSIPLAVEAATVLQAGDQTVTVLNAPARWREHAGRKLPVEEARPNGRSCFKEWLLLHQPPKGSRVILLTHQPNIYRSWLDMIIKAREEGRADLRITAAGAALEPEATVGDVLKGLGDLIINNYNMHHEGGVDIPEFTPFVMKPRPR